MCPTPIQSDLTLKKEILINGYFYDVTNFDHPGGNIISFFINNFQGEDGSLTFRQFHHRSIAKASMILNSLPKRKALPGGTN